MEAYLVLVYDKLSEPERAVWDAAQAGTPVELPLGAPAAADPAMGKTWGDERQVRAELLCELLTGVSVPPDVHPRALKLAGARITGTLDLQAATLVCPLTLRGCFFEQPINLREVKALALRFPGCRVPSFHAQQFQTRGNLELNENFAADRGVSLSGGHIGGTLDCSSATLTKGDGAAMDADGLLVDGGMSFTDRFTAKGEVRLSGAQIKGSVVFDDASFVNPEGVALSAAGLTAEQGMYCTNGFAAKGDVSLSGAHIGGQLVFDRAQVDGEVNLLGARVSGELGFGGASLTNPKGATLLADRLTVGGGMFCTGGFDAKGEVRLSGVQIKGNLELDGAILTSGDRPALEAGGLAVNGNVFCRGGFTAKGTISLSGAHVGGQLVFEKARVDGEVNLVGARVSGELGFVGASLTNPKGAALRAGGLTAEQGMYCSNGFAAKGDVSLFGAHISGQLAFADASLTNPKGLDLDLERCHADTLVLRPLVPTQGIVNLTDAHVDTFYDSEATWPQELLLVGFTYEDLVATPEVDTKARLRWLGRDPTTYTPQLYEQLAAFYRKAGRDDDVRKVAIAKQRRREKSLSWPGKWWNSLLYWTVGYGYQTWKAGLWVLVLVGLGWLIFDGAHPTHLEAAKPLGQRPSFHGGLYALDLLLPFADLGYQSAWITDGWTRWFYLGWNLAGWVLVTAVVAALSGLIKRD